MTHRYDPAAQNVLKFLIALCIVLAIAAIWRDVFAKGF